MKKEEPRWKFERDEARKRAGLTKLPSSAVVSVDHLRIRANEMDKARQVFKLQTFDLRQENTKLRRFRRDVENAIIDGDIERIGHLIDTCGYRPLAGDEDE